MDVKYFSLKLKKHPKVFFEAQVFLGGFRLAREVGGALSAHRQ